MFEKPEKEARIALQVAMDLDAKHAELATLKEKAIKAHENYAKGFNTMVKDNQFEDAQDKKNEVALA